VTTQQERPGTTAETADTADTRDTEARTPRQPASPPHPAGSRSLHDHHPALDHAVVDEQDDHPGLDKWVFGVPAAIAVAFLVWGAVSTDSLSAASTAGLNWVLQNTGWLFVLSASGFVVFVLYLALGKYGRIPLGRDGEEPEFRTVSWIAMMFSAGMGIGLMFFGVSEPLSFAADPSSIPPGTGEGDAETALATTLFHWTLHPWAIYSVVGLAIAYGVYRKGRVQLISAAFEPLLGKRRTEGPIGRVIDMLAIFATLFGSAASLGLGALQIRGGLEFLPGIGKVGNGVLIGLIAVLTAAFVLSAVSGVAKGIQWLSNINMVLALALAIFVFVVGPTVFILNLIPTAIGTYLGDLPQMMARTGAEGQSTSTWLGTWTVFYWAWWISWTPFVGMFLARISRGRTIRQFVAGVVLVPSLVSLVWFAIFGGAAIDLPDASVADIVGAGSTESQLFLFLDNFPLTTVVSVVVMVLVAIFFVSGADAASIVMGTLSERGTTEPRRRTVVFWGVTTGAVGAIMLIIGGSDALTGLQNLTILAALPFLVVMIALCVSLVKDLRADPLMVRSAYASEAVESAVVAGVTQHGDDFAISVEHDHKTGPKALDEDEEPTHDDVRA